MARMSHDDGLGRDTRLDHLAELCGWTKRETAGCLQLDIWPICYDRVTPNIRARDIDIAANRTAVTPVKHPGGFSAALIECELARPATKQDVAYLWTRTDGSEVRLEWRDPEWRDRIYIKGAPERISYLLKAEYTGRLGGKKSGESRGNRAKGPFDSAKGTFDSNEGSLEAPPKGRFNHLNPSASASDLPSASDPVSDPKKEETSPTAPSVSASKPRKPKTRQFTAEQRDIAARILTKLSETNGVRYTGSDAHVALIVDRLNDGIHELELRAIIAHCASPKASGGKGWEESDEMRQYLCPETLFGPKTHTKYLDPARTQYRKQLDEQIGKSPQLRLVEGA